MRGPQKTWQGRGQLCFTLRVASGLLCECLFVFFSTHLGHTTWFFSLTIMSISWCPQIFKTVLKRALALCFVELHYEGPHLWSINLKYVTILNIFQFTSEVGHFSYIYNPLIVIFIFWIYLFIFFCHFPIGVLNYIF